MYQTTHDLDDTALAALLGCAANDLSRLALCRRPAPESDTFRTDIEHLAQRFQLHTGQLASIIRQIDALQAIQQQLEREIGSRGFLQAARDCDEYDLDLNNPENEDG
ncbi:hypothetical protein HC928_10060 [bacterium]|nr:hypothetical protein [bacterium]